MILPFMMLGLVVGSGRIDPSVDEFAAAYYLNCSTQVRVSSVIKEIEPKSLARYLQKSEFDREWRISLEKRAFDFLGERAHSNLPEDKVFSLWVFANLGKYNFETRSFPLKLMAPNMPFIKHGYRLDAAFSRYEMHGSRSAEVLPPSVGEIEWSVSEEVASTIAAQASRAYSVEGNGPRVVAVKMDYKLSGCGSVSSVRRTWYLNSLPVRYSIFHADRPDKYRLDSVSPKGELLGLIDAARN